MNRIALLRSLVLVLVIAASASGWNHTGHRVSAFIAYQQLTPEAKARVNQLLKHHPRYQQDLLKNLPDGADQELWAFMTAATWPDMIRSPAHSLSRKYNRSRWHYINFIYIPAGHEDRVELPDPPPERWIPGAEPDNILQALEWCRTQLQGEGVSDADKAIALCWYLHLVGDLHQPLHTVAIWSEQFPQGDRGGNLFIVRANGRQTNLHSYWDGLLGGYVEPRLIEQVATRAMHDHPSEKLAEELASKDQIKWARESERLARGVAYREGKLSGARKADVEAKGSAAGVPELPDAYAATARGVARRQIVLSGLRMAGELNAMFRAERR